jgi:hypothetical protein
MLLGLLPVGDLWIACNTMIIACSMLIYSCREETDILKQGEIDKVKRYSALCWSKLPVTDEQLATLSNIKVKTSFLIFFSENWIQILEIKKCFPYVSLFLHGNRFSKCMLKSLGILKKPIVITMTHVMFQKQYYHLMVV